MNKLVMFLFVVALTLSVATAAEKVEKKADKNAPPKYIATYYNGGKVADQVECESFTMEGGSRVTFRPRDGQQIHILNGCIVVRETDKTDFEAINAAREKTEQLRKMLAIKRQEASLKKELETQKALLKEIEEASAVKPKTSDVAEAGD